MICISTMEFGALWRPVSAMLHRWLLFMYMYSVQFPVIKASVQYV
jgi:hypothetical protein